MGEISLFGELPKLGVVVPVFQHSGLVAEALCSLSNQVGAPLVASAVVNDGCSYNETDFVCAGFSSQAKKQRLHYLRRRNGGLSASRNTGSNFLLKRYSTIEAIYFLDADNRLESYALARMAQALAEHPEADWFYPDIEMFGLAYVSQYRGDYTGLIHTTTNICEAGSLVRRRVFEAGVHFDEAMRQGYEDWDFWLSAQSRGFKGHNLQQMGFSYRKRPESMLADAHRDDAEIRGYMRRKHRSLYSIKKLLTLEGSEAPRFAIMFDDSSVALAVDPRCPTEFISTDEFTNRFWRWLLRPGVHFTPPFIVCLDKKTFEILGDTGILNWVFWDLECRSRDCHFSAVKLGNSLRSTAEISSESRLNTDITLDAHVVLLKTELAREVCRDVSLEWWNSVIKGMTGVTTSLRLVRVRDRRVMTLPTRFAFSNLFQTVLNLYHSEFRRAAEGRWTWTYSGVPERHTAYQSVRSVVNQGIVFPIKPDGRRHIGILLPFADFGGVEKVAFNTAFELRQAGYVPHLVLFRVGDIHIPAQFQMVFESFLWVTSEGLLSWEGDEFNGTRLSWWSQHGDTSDVVGMLAWFDAVLNCQSSDAHGVMGELKRRAVLTLTHQHVVELSRHGRIGGHPVQAKAFEHSYAAILTCSRQLRSWFVAHGIPQEKLFNIDNAPSYRLADLLLDEIALDRASLSLAARPLRVLFAARLDVQKGLDRLVELIERTTTSHIKVEWRVVGKSIVEHDESLERLQLLVNIEAPVYSEDELTGLYRWADVIVLTSRYEGIPLTIIEAMRCGVIVLSTDAGAIGELIQTGINGFVVPQRNCVSDMVEILRHLSGDETLCRRISKGAIIAGRHRSWKQSLTEVIDFLDQQLGAVKRRRSARMQLRPPCGTSNY